MRLLFALLLALAPALECSAFASVQKDRVVFVGDVWRSDPEVLYAGAKHPSGLPERYWLEPKVVRVEDTPVEVEVELGSGEYDVDGVIVKTWYSEE